MREGPVRLWSVVVLSLVTLVGVGCSQIASPTVPTGSAAASTLGTQLRSEQACWGEATQVFAQLGEMGAHASQQPTPRLGLRNVARALYEADLIPDDTLQALGAFLSSAFGLSIESCL